MIVLVTGGASSGKSKISEEISQVFGGKMLYIATMQPYGNEGKQRIERHRTLREGKGFVTKEKYTNLMDLKCDGYDTILLECMSNLIANELFCDIGSKEKYLESIENGLSTLKRSVKNIVIVTNEIFSDDINYDEETTNYIKALGNVNRYLAKEADVVIEAVVGIKICLKGSLDSL